MRNRVFLVVVIFVLPLLSVSAFAQRGRKVSGTVTAKQTGQPVVGAVVQYDEGGISQSTTTDGKGYFEFSEGRRGVVTVTASDFGTARRRWPPPRGSQLTIVMEPPAFLAGTLMDAATGRGVAGAVTVMVQDAGGFTSLSGRAASGAYEIGDLPSGPAVVMASAEGYAPAWRPVSIESGESHTAAFRLDLEALATGTVVDAGGLSVAGAYVFASYSDEEGAYGMLDSLVGGVPWTDAQGRFGLGGLIPDVPITLQAESADGELSNTVTVTIPPGSVRRNVELRLP